MNGTTSGEKKKIKGKKRAGRAAGGVSVLRRGTSHAPAHLVFSAQVSVLGCGSGVHARRAGKEPPAASDGSAQQRARLFPSLFSLSMATPVLSQIPMCSSKQETCLHAVLDAWKFTPWSKPRKKVPADSILLRLGAAEEASPLAKEPRHPCQRCPQGGQGCDTDSVPDSVGWERLLG